MTTKEDLDRVARDEREKTNMVRDIKALQEWREHSEKEKAVWRSRVMKLGVAFLVLDLSQTEPGSNLLVRIAEAVSKVFTS